MAVTRWQDFINQKHHDHARHKGGLGPGGAGHDPGLRLRVAQVRKPGVPMQPKFQVVKMIMLTITSVIPQHWQI